MGGSDRVHVWNCCGETAGLRTRAMNEWPVRVSRELGRNVGPLYFPFFSKGKCSGLRFLHTKRSFDLRWKSRRDAPIGAGTIRLFTAFQNHHQIVKSNHEKVSIDTNIMIWRTISMCDA